MDAGCCCWCRWLLQTVLIIFLHPNLKVLGTTRECPQGQLLHVRTRPSYITCCYPTRCSVGEQVAPCKINGTHDTCQMCGAFQNQSLRTSSFTMERCSDWPLDKNCKSVNNPDRPRDFRDEQTKRCMCNIEQGKKFYPPEYDTVEAPMDSYCQRRYDPCEAGHEPKVDGGCEICRNNYFKSEEGFNLCRPKINCTLLGLEFTVISNETGDNKCSEPERVITTKSSNPHKPNTVIPVPKTTSMISTTPAVTTSTENLLHSNTSLSFARRHKDEDKILWPVVCTAVFLICVLAAIGLIMIYRRRRRGLPIRICGKDLRDPEKNTQGNHIVKHNNGAVPSHHMINGDKVVNNSVNGEVPFDTTDLSNGHANGNIPHEYLNPVEYRSDGLEQYTNPAHHQPVRPGILRTSNRNVVFGQRQDNMPDMISDLGPEKLRVNLVANSNLGEGDCLLVAGFHRGTSYDDIQNWPASVGNSSSPVQAGVNSGQVLALNGCGRANYGLINNNPFFPTTQPHREAVVYSPATDMVIFTRSGSVITSPVDDVGEDTGAARIPRFSQLLQDGEDVSAAGSAETSIETCVLNPPIQLQDQGNKPQPQQPGVLAAAFEPEEPRRLQTRQPDHYIMNLKEQDIVDSEQLSSISANSNTELKTVKNDLREPASSEESQLTDPKTLMCQGADRVVDTSGGNLKTSKAAGFKQSNAIGRSCNLQEKKRCVNTGGNERTPNEKKSVQSDKNLKNSADIKLAPNGDSNQNVHDHRRVPDNSELKSCVKTSSSKEHDSDKEKPCRYNRVVSFEENNTQTGNKHHDPKTHPRQSPRLQNSEKVDSGSVSDTEQANAAEGASAIDGTEWRSVHQKHAVPSSPVKTSVSADGSPSPESGSSPVNSVIYRRSQSQNTSSSSESTHKPPPRSMSEDKQHKMDRPIAKVKPMPTSDSCVNQLQGEVSDVGAAPPPPPAPGTNSRFSSSSEDSGTDHNTEERYLSTSVTENGDRGRAEEELEGYGI